MADQKISELTELAAGNVANDDELAIVDTSTTSTKRWTWASIKSDILSWFGSASATLTNKTIDADSNTLSNIGDEELKAGIDAAKIADGSVSNTEFQYVNGVTSAIQTQIDGKADSSHTHTLTDITDSGALAALDTVGTAEIDNDAVTFDKIANIATNRVLARSSAGSGSVEALTLPNFRTLINVEDGADVTDTANVTAAGALMDSEVTDLAGIKSLDTSTLQVKPSEGAFVDGDKTKLDGIETGADVTDETNVVSALSGATLSDAGTPQATDKVLVQDASDSDNLKYVDFSDFSSGTTVDVVSNVAADRILGRVTAGSGDSEELTAAQVRSLINVEDGADVTDTANVTSAGALMDSELTDLAGIKALDTSTLQVKPSEGAFVDGDKTKLDGIEAGADVTDTANVTAAGALMDSEVDADIKTLSLPANTTISTFGASLIDDASASAARTTLGLGSLATDSAIDVAIGIACSDETTALTTGSAKVTFRMPYAMTLTDVRASLTGAGSTSGTTTIDINESGSTVLSTKLTIDQGEKTSETAATAAVISDSALADDAEITIDIDAVTGGADETGLKVWLIGTRSV